jgi:hypothetical protein
MWTIRNAYRILIEKPEGKRLLMKIRHTWRDNKETGLK